MVSPFVNLPVGIFSLFDKFVDFVLFWWLFYFFEIFVITKMLIVIVPFPGNFSNFYFDLENSLIN